MPAFHVVVPHGLGRQEARRRLEGFLASARERLSGRVSEMSGTWTGDELDFSMTTYGLKLSGKLSVLDDCIRIDGQLPFAAVAFRGQIEQSFATEIERVLSAG